MENKRTQEQLVKAPNDLLPCSFTEGAKAQTIKETLFAGIVRISLQFSVAKKSCRPKNTTSSKYCCTN